MLALSLTAMVEAAVLLTPAEKRLSGQVLEPEKLFEARSLAALEEAHDGIFGFLAFDPNVDAAVVDYLSLGSLADDSGPRVLVLFTLARRAALPVAVTASALDFVRIERGALPALLFLHGVYRPDVPPPLPGLIVFERVSDTCRPVYFPLADARDASEVAARVRAVASLATAVARDRGERRDDYGKALAVAATKQRILHHQPGPKPVGAQLVRAYRFAAEHAGDIVGVLGLI